MHLISGGRTALALVSLVGIGGAAFHTGHALATGRSMPRVSSPSVTGTWAMEGTGPAGLVASKGRLATLIIRQHGHTLTGTLRAGSHTYPLTGFYYYPKPTLTLKRQLPHVGVVHLSGTLQRGATRVLGLWSDARGDDVGTILVRVAH